MKQQEIAILIIIIAFAGIFSFLLSSKFITPSKEKMSVEVVSAIEPSFPVPDGKVFNSDAVNPTVRIEIAPVDNPEPFNQPGR